jgi:hypothetical protein
MKNEKLNEQVKWLLLFLVISLIVSCAIAMPANREPFFPLGFVPPQLLAGLWGM